MDDIDVLTLQHLAEILVGLNVGAPRFLGCLEMVFIDITNRQKLGLRVDVFEVSSTHTTHTDDSLGDDLAGRNLAFSDDVTGHDADGCRRGNSATGKLPTGDLICLFHMPAGETVHLLAVKIKDANVLWRQPAQEGDVFALLRADFGRNLDLKRRTLCG